MNSIQVGHTIIGKGLPKICIPMIGKTKEELLLEVESLKGKEVDLVEWRVDWFDEVESIDEVIQTGYLIKNQLEEIPLIFTFRSKREGGEKELTKEQYLSLIYEVANSNFTQLIDVEMLKDQEVVRFAVEKIHEKGKYVLGSSHEFSKTPSKDEMVERLLFMEKQGADLLKLAVMPQKKEDVLELLQAAVALEAVATKPIVVMSMGALGWVSRVLGEYTGSVITFAKNDSSSAPGQLEVEKVREALSLLHQLSNESLH